jgi:hypothetical protein
MIPKEVTLEHPGSPSPCHECLSRLFLPVLSFLFGLLLFLFFIVVIYALPSLQAGLSMQEAAFPDRAARFPSQVELRATGHAGGRDTNSTDAAVLRRRRMWDLFGDGVFAADLGDTDVRGFSGLREGIIARVEVFSFLDNGNVTIGLGKMKRGVFAAYFELVL